MLMIDFSPISIAAGFMCGEELSEDLLRHMTLNSILSYKKKFRKLGATVIAFDDTSKDYWRKDLHPAYKGHRAELREKSNFDFKSFYKYQEIVKEEFRDIFPYHWIQIPRLEADDIIGRLALTAKEPTVIVSPDGDFEQTQRNPRVRVYSNLKKKFAPEKTLWEIELDLHKKLLKGDPGDNINNVFHALEDTPARQKPVTERLVEHTYECGLGQDIKERYEQNKKLIDLREIPEEYCALIDEAINTPVKGSKARIFNYLASRKLNRVGSFIKDVEDFC